MSQLILLRHGQSEWNLQNKFTGWVDVGLSSQGIEEAVSAGKKIVHKNIDEIFTSTLKRAIDTANIVVKNASLIDITIHKNEALNERHYGDLQGLNKDETRQKFGEEQVHIWRRSYDIKPPNGESLKDTCERVIPYYKNHILPLLQKGKNILIVAHGNSLRGLIKQLQGYSADEIIKVEIPTGMPILYELDLQGNFLKKEIL